jgi:hypothetical protein
VIRTVGAAGFADGVAAAALAGDVPAADPMVVLVFPVHADTASASAATAAAAETVLMLPISAAFPNKARLPPSPYIPLMPQRYGLATA